MRSRRFWLGTPPHARDDPVGGERQHRLRGAAPLGAQPQHATGLVVHLEPVVERAGVGHGAVAEIESEVGDETGLRSEGERAHAGINAIGADHQVVGADGSAPEGDLDAARCLVERAYAVAVDDVGLAGDELVQDDGEVAFHDLELGDGAAVAGEEVGRHGRKLSTVAVDVAEALLGHEQFADARQDPHPLGDDLAESVQVDGLAAEPQRRRLFDDRRSDAVGAEPVGEGRTGDSAGSRVPSSCRTACATPSGLCRRWRRWASTFGRWCTSAC